jgi:formate/nitrite transporter FocA (FNT family)
VLAGVSCCLGLVLVIVGGAELFTGNNLLLMAFASRKITLGRVLRNWVLVYLGNFLGAVLTAVGMQMAGLHRLGHGAVGKTALDIAAAKCSLDLGEAFVRGVYCNTLHVVPEHGGEDPGDHAAGHRVRGRGIRALGGEHVLRALRAAGRVAAG